MARRRSKRPTVFDQHNQAIKRFLSTEESVREHIEEVVKQHEDRIVFLTFEDKRALKLYSCANRCRHCAICKCGVVVWRESRNDGRRYRFLSPFDWIDDPEDLLLSSLVNVLKNVDRVPSLLVLSIPRGCYEDINHLILGFALLMDLLPIRQIHVFLSKSGDDSFHYADLKKKVQEKSCRTVQEVASLPLPDGNLWMTWVGMPLFKIVDITSTLATNPIDTPSTFFVLARNVEGEVTYRTSSFLSEKMWKEVDWSIEIPRLRLKYEEEQGKGTKEQSQEKEKETSSEEASQMSHVDSRNDDAVSGENEGKETDDNSQMDTTLVMKKEAVEEEAEGDEGTEGEGYDSQENSLPSTVPNTPRRVEIADSDMMSLRAPDSTAEPPAKRRKPGRPPRMLLELKGTLLSPKKEIMGSETGIVTRRRSVMEKRARTVSVDEDEEEEDPHGEVVVFKKSPRASEERRAIAGKMHPTVPRLDSSIQKMIKRLEKNGDSTVQLVNQWNNIGEMIKPKTESLLAALQEIASRMNPIALSHPMIDPKCYFHDLPTAAQVP